MRNRQKTPLAMCNEHVVNPMFELAQNEAWLTKHFSLRLKPETWQKAGCKCPR